jgi:hypothetical protein
MKLVLMLAAIAIGAAGPAVADGNRISVRNEASHTLVGVEIDPVGTVEWSIFHLDPPLHPGERVQFEIGRPDCRYDFRFRFDDLSQSERLNVDVCKEDELRVTE